MRALIRAARLALMAAIALLAVVVLFLLFQPWPILLGFRDPDRTALMEERIDAARSEGETLTPTRTWVPLARISPHLRRAVVVAEDARFYEHGGIDWLALREELRYTGDADFAWTDTRDLRALAGAVDYYRRNRAEVRGRSTITQQLAKNLYFGTERSLVRKVREFIVARRLERFLTKDRILELYLNVVEWGPGIFGAEAAARHYFGRSASELTREQAAALAATLPHPLTINPARRPERMAWRQRMILQRMGGTEPARTVPLAPLDAGPPPAHDPEPADGVPPGEELLGEPIPLPDRPPPPPP